MAIAVDFIHSQFNTIIEAIQSEHLSRSQLISYVKDVEQRFIQFELPKAEETVQTYSANSALNIDRDKNIDEVYQDFLQALEDLENGKLERI